MRKGEHRIRSEGINMQEIYQRVASLFANRITQIFESEAALEAEFQRHFEGLPFDRTDHWGSILLRMVSEAWYTAGPEVKASPTSYDISAILSELHPLLDYNLFTQVLMNLQNLSLVTYLALDAAVQLEGLRKAWAQEGGELNPFAPKAKMVKNAAKPIDVLYNNAISTIRALKIIAGFTPLISFRVSPKRSTPAFADSRNISMLGVGGDKYLRTIPPFAAYYIGWEPDSTPKMTANVGRSPEGAVLRTEGIGYDFVSKSGGEILGEVLFARKLVYEIFAAYRGQNHKLAMIPRVNSILIITDEPEILKQVFARLNQQYSMLTLYAGTRI